MALLVPSPCFATQIALVTVFATSPPVIAQTTPSGDLDDVHVIERVQAGAGGPATSGFSYSIQPSATNLRKLDDLLVEAGLASWDASGSFGLATTIQSRGFSLNPQSAAALSGGKILLNGHPDIGRRFVRDPVTVEKVSYYGMTDATVAGASTPSGTVLLQSKVSTGKPHFRYSLAGASNGLARWTLDAERELGPVQLRLIAAQQAGDKTVEGVVDRHTTVLLSAQVASSTSSNFRLDLESQTTHLPFPFGTVYAGNQVWFDRAYVSAAESKATRRNDRVAAYGDFLLSGNTSLRFHAQRATGRRNEDLLGFWTVTTPNTLSSYARHLDETYDQADWGVNVESAMKLGNQTHHTRLSYARSLQALDFSGPQNIGAFRLDVADPQFTTPFSAISLTPRLLKEQYSESTWAVSDRIVFSPRWELHGAVTHNAMRIESSATTAPMALVAVQGLTNVAVTGNHRLTDAMRLWVGWSDAFEPNRGQMKSGDFLPPKRARQTEFGGEFRQGTQKLQISIYDIDQSNLAGVDPADKNYVVPVGSARSSGLQFSARQSWASFAVYTGATFQRARTIVTTSAAQGPYLPGIADRYGVVGATWQPRERDGLSVDMKMIAIGDRPGDSVGSFFAPGAAVWNLNVSGKVPGVSAAQWSIGVTNLFDTAYIRALSAADFVWQGERRKLMVAWQQSL